MRQYYKLTSILLPILHFFQQIVYVACTVVSYNYLKNWEADFRECCKNFVIISNQSENKLKYTVISQQINLHRSTCMYLLLISLYCKLTNAKVSWSFFYQGVDSLFGFYGLLDYRRGRCHLLLFPLFNGLQNKLCLARHHDLLPIVSRYIWRIDSRI